MSKENDILKNFKVKSMELTINYNKTKFNPKLVNLFFEDKSGNNFFISLTKEELFRKLIITHFK